MPLLKEQIPETIKELLAFTGTPEEFATKSESAYRLVCQEIVRILGEHGYADHIST